MASMIDLAANADGVVGTRGHPTAEAPSAMDCRRWHTHGAHHQLSPSRLSVAGRTVANSTGVIAKHLIKCCNII